MTYDGFGRLRSTRSSTGYRLVFSYDAMNRQTKTTYPTAPSTRQSGTGLTRFFKKTVSAEPPRRIRFNGPEGAEVDPLEWKTSTNGAHAAPWLNLRRQRQQNQVASRYSGRLTSKVYADNSTVNYSYEPFAGWLRSRTDALSQTTRYYFQPRQHSAQSRLCQPRPSTEASLTPGTLTLRD
ncbi:MAG: RHS repeat protein [Candidatus Obscuribacter sp.]|nr:RHS repeat protein [Candidatus Obscuribacter sp.]